MNKVGIALSLIAFGQSLQKKLVDAYEI